MSVSDHDQGAPIFFRGDITTGEGMIRVADRLVRDFAMGRLSQRRFEAMLHGLLQIARLRGRFSAPPIDGPADFASCETTIMDADLRPAQERARELAGALPQRSGNHAPPQPITQKATVLRFATRAPNVSHRR